MPWVAKRPKRDFPAPPRARPADHRPVVAVDGITYHYDRTTVFEVRVWTDRDRAGGCWRLRFRSEGDPAAALEYYRKAAAGGRLVMITVGGVVAGSNVNRIREKQAPKEIPHGPVPAPGPAQPPGGRPPGRTRPRSP